MTRIMRIFQSWVSDEAFLEVMGLSTGVAVLVIGSTLGSLSLLSR